MLTGARTNGAGRELQLGADADKERPYVTENTARVRHRTSMSCKSAPRFLKLMYFSFFHENLIDANAGYVSACRSTCDSYLRGQTRQAEGVNKTRPMGEPHASMGRTTRAPHR